MVAWEWNTYVVVSGLQAVTQLGIAFAFSTINAIRHWPCLLYWQDAHHSLIDDYEVIVDYYRQHLMPGWIPRRLGMLTHSTLFDLSALIELSALFIKGGGLGGKKESGQLRFGGRERPFRAPLCVLGLKFELLCLIISTHYFLSNYFRVSAVPRKFFFTKQLPMTKMLHVFLPKQTPNSVCRFTTAWYSTSTWRAIYVTFSGIIFLDLVPTSSDKLFNYHHLLMSFFIFAKF